MTMPFWAQPDRIVVAGDWHGNSEWATYVIAQAGYLLTGERDPLIVQLGDFGLWPGEFGQHYLHDVHRACINHNVNVAFIDGNHEDFTQLASGVFEHSTSRVRWLFRGHRWIWHGRTWLACGGAVSLDRAIRIQDVSWWPDEEINEGQKAKIIADGKADVMVTHDCPAGVTHTFPPPPRFWDARDLARSDRHRENLQIIVDEVQPRHLMHGHLHRAYQRECDFGYGQVQVTGMDMDGTDGNYGVLDVRTMEWQ